MRSGWLSTNGSTSGRSDVSPRRYARSGTLEIHLDLIPELARQGCGVLLASHLLHEVEHVCDRVAIIRGGRSIESGRVSELVARGGYLEAIPRPREKSRTPIPNRTAFL